jgi:Ca2+-binding EF-hand superfamily protein
MDDDDSGSLDITEFYKAMKECQVSDLSKKAIEHLFRFFDSDDSGSVSYDEFLVGVR